MSHRRNLGFFLTRNMRLRDICLSIYSELYHETTKHNASCVLSYHVLTNQHAVGDTLKEF